eukprot:CAMPEP_0170498416 /NCGR_PEP_ID=MMETSP0208-20121228/27763_1 /TAXON_ID=197538 /ORGANISM="Strombidium inclinatum, Strain S3" /LENGTH=183 /DNA_ID=CAMNT_0010775583 /DNA_START=532 /DNA_END=1083 /DNA_ORIENTATION=-
MSLQLKFYEFTDYDHNILCTLEFVPYFFASDDNHFIAVPQYDKSDCSKSDVLIGFKNYNKLQPFDMSIDAGELVSDAMDDYMFLMKPFTFLNRSDNEDGTIEDRIKKYDSITKVLDTYIYNGIWFKINSDIQAKETQLFYLYTTDLQHNYGKIDKKMNLWQFMKRLILNNFDAWQQETVSPIV